MFMIPQYSIGQCTFITLQEYIEGIYKTIIDFRKHNFRFVCIFFLLSRYYASKGKRLRQLTSKKMIYSTFGSTYRQIHSAIAANLRPLSYEKHPEISFLRYYRPINNCNEVNITNIQCHLLFA